RCVTNYAMGVRPPASIRLSDSLDSMSISSHGSPNFKLLNTCIERFDSIGNCFHELGDLMPSPYERDSAALQQLTCQKSTHAQTCSVHPDLRSGATRSFG